jgi:bifunctional non-homologous end joining protein LigD
MQLIVRPQHGASARVAFVPVPQTFIPPELATLVDRPPNGEGWIHEIKHDGYRMPTRLTGGKVAMLTRNALDWTARFRPIADAVTKLRVRSAYIDGEIVALNGDGISDFGALQQALSDGRADELVYFAFDLLRLDGKDLARLPLVGGLAPDPGGGRGVAAQPAGGRAAELAA